MGTENQLPKKEDTAEDVVPKAAEGVQLVKGNNGAILHCHHLAHPALLCHCLVRCLHCQR